MMKKKLIKLTKFGKTFMSPKKEKGIEKMSMNKNKKKILNFLSLPIPIKHLLKYNKRKSS
jgi:hypothetical protein